MSDALSREQVKTYEAVLVMVPHSPGFAEVKSKQTVVLVSDYNDLHTRLADLDELESLTAHCTKEWSLELGHPDGVVSLGKLKEMVQARLAEQTTKIEHFTKQIDQLARFFIEQYPEAIHEGGAVDVAIAYIGSLKQQVADLTAKLEAVECEKGALYKERNQLRAMLDRIDAIPGVADGYHAPNEENIADGVEALADHAADLTAQMAVSEHAAYDVAGTIECLQQQLAAVRAEAVRALAQEDEERRLKERAQAEAGRGNPFDRTGPHATIRPCW